MRIYNYHPTTREFAGSDVARQSPLERDVYAIPANATTIEPPLAGDKKVAVFRDGTWELVPDRRGERWYLPDGSELTIANLDVVPDPAWSQTRTPKPEELAAKARADRVTLLVEADCAINVLEDAGKDALAWRKYRQALRDIPAQKGFPNKITWPDKP